MLEDATDKVKSGGALTVVASVVESLVVFNSPPPATVAVFVKFAAAVAETVPVTVIAGYDAPNVKTSARVQESVDTSHVHPVPVSPVTV